MTDGFEKGQALSEHTSPFDAMVMVLEGALTLTIGGVPLRAEPAFGFARRTQRTGLRVNGKVLPVDERFFNHWNHNPFSLDTGGNGNELADGAVFLLPYYMGLYHGFIKDEAVDKLKRPSP